MADLLVLDQLPDHTAIAPADDKHVLHMGVHRHGHVGDHLVVNEFILLCQHQVPVRHKDPAELPGVQHIDPLELALGAEKLFLDADGQLHVLCVFI